MMRLNKMFAGILLAVCLTMALVGCGNNRTNTTEKNADVKTTEKADTNNDNANADNKNGGNSANENNVTDENTDDNAGTTADDGILNASGANDTDEDGALTEIGEGVGRAGDDIIDGVEDAVDDVTGDRTVNGDNGNVDNADGNNMP